MRHREPMREIFTSCALSWLREHTEAPCLLWCLAVELWWRGHGFPSGNLRQLEPFENTIRAEVTRIRMEREDTPHA